MGLGRNSACFKVCNEQKQSVLSEYSMVSRANGGSMKISFSFLEPVSCDRSEGETEDLRKNQHRQDR